MPCEFSVEVLDAVAADIVTELNASLGSSAVLEFWEGTMPANCSDPDTGNLLATVNLANPVWGAPSGAVFQTSATSPTTVTTGGTCSYFRMKDGGGDCHVQGECSDSGVVPILLNTVTFGLGDSLQFDFIIFTTTMTSSP